VAPSSAAAAALHRAEQAQERVRRLVLFPLLAFYLCAYLGVLVRPRHPSLTAMLAREEDGVGPGRTGANMKLKQFRSCALRPPGRL